MPMNTPWRFPKGKSGNPGGRPKIPPEVKELARAHSVDALKALAAIVKSAKAPPSARVQAAIALLDRGYGKPTQQIEATVNVLDRMTYDEQRTIAEALDALAGSENNVEGGIASTHH